MNPLANHLRHAFRSLAFIGVLALAASRLPGSPSAAPDALNQRTVRSHSLFAGHPLSVRATAIAWNILILHALGDVPSPTMMGAVADYRSLQAAFILPVIAMAISSAILFYGMRFAPVQASEPEPSGVHAG